MVAIEQVSHDHTLRKILVLFRFPGFRFQVSGVRAQMTEDRGQKTEVRHGAIGSQFSFCRLTSVFFFLKPDPPPAEHLKPLTCQ
jgi:hypothetical protein